jgi:Flp pilus assembly protein TadD
MMRGFLTFRAYGAWALLAFAATAAVVPVPAAAQASYPAYAESPAAALARHVRTLAASPNDFSALIGAGRAALALGDTQAAAGFFARADEANPRSPMPQAGMGAVSVASGEAQGALPYFTRALQLGGSVALIGADRGLAYDLLGRQAQAQADYRTALGGLDGDEARRRLALSLAIGGDRAGALQALAPLLGRGDPGAGRVRAFILALTGDSQGAMRAIDAAMPGSWARVAPFLQRLPALSPGQKAAACNLGIFPDAGATAVASVSGVPAYSVTTDRLAGIDDLLRDPAPQPSAPPVWQPPPQSVQTAYAAPVRQPTASATPRARKIWLQLASGPNPDALSGQFRRIKSQNRDLFDGIHGYVAKGPGRARLVIGPFRGPADAQIFAEDLKSVDIDSFSWTNSESDQIVPLGTE